MTCQEKSPSSRICLINLGFSPRLFEEPPHTFFFVSACNSLFFSQKPNFCWYQLFLSLSMYFLHFIVSSLSTLHTYTTVFISVHQRKHHYYYEFKYMHSGHNKHHDLKSSHGSTEEDWDSHNGSEQRTFKQPSINKMKRLIFFFNSLLPTILAVNISELLLRGQRRFCYLTP